ncbi:uncharacterized protein [Primulina eburnea]|uniref:uncharacterized protein n=1 Tax=Primulina eburnea TaxID=1245227 RepID=UPI003C6CAB43
MKESILMRVLFCKIHCPLICFCKPSVAHLYCSEPLKLENSTPSTVPTEIAGSDSFDNKSCGEGKEERVNWNTEANFVGKSCIKKPPAIVPKSTEEIVRKRVQWIDNFGKELAQIKEFESSHEKEQLSAHCSYHRISSLLCGVKMVR